MSIRVMTDDGGKSRGFGFVSFERHEDAQKVIRSPGGTCCAAPSQGSQGVGSVSPVLAGGGRDERQGDERQAHLRGPRPEEGGAPDGAQAQI